MGAGPSSPAGISMTPYQHTKIVHLIRHAEGFHNVAGYENKENYKSEAYFDAHLTTKGWGQVSMLRKHLRKIEDFKADLVVVSPFSRTLETASGIFGEFESSKGSSLLMKEQPLVEGSSSKMEAIFWNEASPFVASELCREVSGLHPCDRRRTISHYKSEFPAVDFSLVESEEDKLWSSQGREHPESVHSRVTQFLDFLAARPEKNIAVVSHSGFLRAMCRHMGKQISSKAKSSLEAPFANCESRTVILASVHLDSSGQCPSSFKPSGNSLPVS